MYNLTLGNVYEMDIRLNLLAHFEYKTTKIVLLLFTFI